MLKDSHVKSTYWKKTKERKPLSILYDLSELTNRTLEFKMEDLNVLHLNPFKRNIKSIKHFYKLKKEQEDIKAKSKMLQRVSK